MALRWGELKIMSFVFDSVTEMAVFTCQIRDKCITISILIDSYILIESNQKMSIVNIKNITSISESKIKLSGLFDLLILSF